MSEAHRKILNWCRKSRLGYVMRELRDGTLVVTNCQRSSEPEYSGKTWEEVAEKLVAAGYDL